MMFLCHVVDQNFINNRIQDKSLILLPSYLEMSISSLRSVWFIFCFIILIQYAMSLNAKQCIPRSDAAIFLIKYDLTFHTSLTFHTNCLLKRNLYMKRLKRTGLPSSFSLCISVYSNYILILLLW